MKTLLSVIFLVTCYISSAFAQASLEVTIKNIKGRKGNIRVGLFSNEHDFLKNVVYGKIVKADASEVTVVFENLPSGDYAVSVIHDENENGELDSSKLGIPKEGFAFGNNAMGNFGPPTFDKAKIAMNGKPVNQVISMKYF